MGKSFPQLETRDLILREITDLDLEPYYALYTDSAVMRTWGTQRHASREDTKALIAMLGKAFEAGSAIRWGIELKQSKAFIGDVGFWRFVKERHRAEAGAKLAKSHWSGGLMTQALGAIIEYGFHALDLHSVEANVDPDNLAAIRMVEKVGFIQEGLIREHSYCSWNKRFIDTALFSVVKPYWKGPESITELT